MDEKKNMKVLDLFSGIGGFSLGLESTGNFKTVAFCDNDKFCKLILDKHWKGVKIYDDVKEISKKKFKEDGIDFPDIITGGFPCQPFSVAGKQQGTSDSRHLWPEMFRIIQEFSPRWVIGENVKGLTNIQDGVVFETVCTDLEGEGYEVRTFNIPAAGVQAPHRRERIWIVAHAKCFNERKSIRESDETQSRIQKEHRPNDNTTWESSRTGSVWGTNNGHEDMENSRRTLRQGSELQGKNGNETKEGNADQSQRSSGTSKSNVVDSSTGRCASQETEVQPGRYSSFDSSWWQSEPQLGRVANGVSGRVHRLKALGNSIVPKIVQEIGNAIIQAEKEKDLEILDERNGF
jgi:DNA (cytosine-5)-methyltransferase 1